MQVAVYNPTNRPIYDFRVGNFLVSFLDDRITEVSEEIAEAAMKEFPQLKIIGRENEVEIKLEKEHNEGVLKPFEKPQEEEKYVCSICDDLREFKNGHGLRIHMKKLHNA